LRPERGAFDNGQSDKCLKAFQLAENYSKDSFWLGKHIFDDAESKYFENKKQAVEIQKVFIKEKSDGDDNGDDEDGSDALEHRRGESQVQGGRCQQRQDHHDTTVQESHMYSWSDETTYLKPSIPVMEPRELKMEKPVDLVDYCTLDSLQMETFQVYT
jgi:hypothetical protein